MTEFLIYSLLGAGGLLAVVWCTWGAFLRYPADPTEFEGDGPQLPPREIELWLSSPVDLEYIRRTGSPAVQRLFAEERKRLALSYLKRLRGAALQLYRRHLTAAKTADSLNPVGELVLACSFLHFNATYIAAAILIRLRGPGALAPWANGIARFANRISVAAPSGTLESASATGEAS